MAVSLLAIGVFQWFFTDDYYAAQKRKIMLESWNRINDADSSDVPESFVNYCAVNGLTYCVADPTLQPLSTNIQDDVYLASRLFGNVMNMESDNTVILEQNEDYNLIQIHDRFSDLDYLELWGVLNDGNYYLVNCSMQSISDAAAISIRFYIYIGLVVIALSCIAVYLITRRLTQPVRELTDLSKKMADLDFDARYESGGEDEIGELGHNFNVMSEKLEKAVSELKSANARLEADIAEKTQIDEMRREFLANVSHELKTPIALVQGYAEGLKDNISDDAESREFYCDVIIDEASKMNTMVKRLLTLNQLEFGNDRLDMERFDLTAVIRGVLQRSKLLIEQSGAEVLFEQDQPVWVWGDEFKIEAVITNYLTNALHYAEGEKVVSIRTEEADGLVTTTVFNTGKPIPASELDKIWTKFYKIDKARTREYGGNGIGLSIVKAIMDAHQQQYGVQNYQNGVAFFFTLESRVNL